ncbi:MAG: zf-HC2 domain-containing protein [Candidatus Rokubacteria bacterium]|nr:zf-HC2 domain-containing protein [Candidatus Rokubacteria bacterium]
MTCRDVEQLLGHFVDAELPPPMLLAVARHAGSCAACDQAARELTELHEAIAHTVEADVAGFDFSRVWPEVERRITPERPRVAGGWRRISSTPLWGGALAAAASALFFLQMPANVTQVATSKPKPAIVKPDRNQAFIDRLAGKRVAVRREPKSGTTMIWVNYDPSESSR